LAIVDIRFGAAVDLGDGPSIDQIDSETSPFQELIERNPVHAGGLHGDRIDTTLGKPIGDRFQINGKGAEGANRLGIAIGGDGNPMDTVVDVDASGSGILHRQGRLRLGSQGVGRSTRGGIWAFGHGNLKEKKKGQTRGGQEGEKGYAVSQTGSGTAGSKTRRPCRQRSSRRLPDHTESRARSTKGLAGHGPPLHVMIAHAQGNAQSSFQMHRCRGSEER